MQINNVAAIAAKFGGQTALAAAIGKNQSTVAHWVKTGVIPNKWHPHILLAAKSHGIEISPTDFSPVAIQEKVGEHKTYGNAIPDNFATHAGKLQWGNVEVSVYVLRNRERVISQTAATEALTEIKTGGNLEDYIGVQSLKDYIDIESIRLSFTEILLDGVNHTKVRAIRAETFLEICTAYVDALKAGDLKTDRQREIAIQCATILAACSKIGLVALIDEVTGYQYEREEDALQIKLKLYLAEEMRVWEKTFPDELWNEFGRLTCWAGAVHQRPKYWGKLVNELVYEYLDTDVFEWLKVNQPQPRHGRNYHQWLSDQYGLKRLTEHIWMLIGMASACRSMRELRIKMAEKYGKVPRQLTFFE